MTIVQPSQTPSARMRHNWRISAGSCSAGVTVASLLCIDIKVEAERRRDLDDLFARQVRVIARDLLDQGLIAEARVYGVSHHVLIASAAPPPG